MSELCVPRSFSGVPEDNLTSMTILARAYDIHVVLASVLPTHDHGDDNGQRVLQSTNRPSGQISALNERIKDLATLLLCPGPRRLRAEPAPCLPLGPSPPHHRRSRRAAWCP
ncbi:MAG: hypothetical protein K0S45_2451 [Nitrospira sp.]|nr:hypothetical protein [Nitrospira sp.]